MKASELVQWIVYSLLCCWNFAALLMSRRMATYYPPGHTKLKAHHTTIKIGLLLFSSLFMLLLCGYGSWAAAWNARYGGLYYSDQGLPVLLAAATLALITVGSMVLLGRERARRRRYLATAGIDDLLSASALARLALLRETVSDSYLSALAERLRWLAERAEQEEPLADQIKIIFDASELETLTALLADSSDSALRRIHAELALMSKTR